MSISRWTQQFGNQMHAAFLQITETTEIERVSKLAEILISLSINFKVEYPPVVTFEKRRKRGTQILREMKNNLEKMLTSTTQSVNRVVEQAEIRSNEYEFKKELKYDYLNARKVIPDKIDSDDEESDIAEQSEIPESHNKLLLKKVERFDNILVNLNRTTVHVPINVYDQADNVINAIKWSAHLDSIFKESYENIPTLTWQYFCSSEGFMRQYPGIKWEGTDPDLYDCRVRNWYIQAAASPKDIVILLDLSGSMAGLRKEIAKHVVHNLLDTLSDNDFVSVMNFSATTDPLVPCFGDELVQANMENIRAFKTHLDTLETQKIANFSDSLVKAFNILEKSSKTGRTSGCNKAIMVVTDGAPYTYESLFRKYNWLGFNSTVRVFTYLIGREVTERREVKWMACANQGYFSHVTTLSEVREQILKYIPVMARPLVMNEEHPLTWTNVYADITDPKMSDYLWNSRIRRRTRKFMEYAYNTFGDGFSGGMTEESKVDPDSEVMDESINGLRPDEYYVTYEYESNFDDLAFHVVFMELSLSAPSLKLMTTASVPVLDMKNKMEEPKLLGVVGIDVPIENIKQLLPPYKLGTYGYVFAISNNGHILFHPDHRPLFDDILKPNYNSVDLTEVELEDSDSGPREFSEELLQLRKYMIDRVDSNSLDHLIKFPVNFHYDRMKRVTTRKNIYHFTPIKNTPFTLGIALPERYPYELVGKIDLRIMTYLNGNYTIHPKWVYCQYRNLSNPFDNNKDLLYSVLTGDTTASFTEPRVLPPLGTMRKKRFCDKELIESLLFDAMLSRVEKDGGNDNRYDEKITTVNMYGATLTYLGTRSGFTKYEYFDEKDNCTEGCDEVPDRTMDELYYKQAVDFNSQTSLKAFVFTVPINSYRRNSSEVRITASHTIFMNFTDEAISVPWGVVGINLRHEKFSRALLDGLTFCPSCNLNCSSDAYRCYALDNNGLVVVSSDPMDTGKFFGEIDVNLLNALLQYNVYKVLVLMLKTVYDYQAVCLDVISSSSSGNLLLTVKSNVLGWFSDAYAVDVNYYAFFEVPNKTRPRPCDKQIDLYEFAEMSSRYINGIITPCHRNCERKFVTTLIPGTNLVLFVVNEECKCHSPIMIHQPEEVLSNGSDAICLENQKNIYRRPPAWKCQTVLSKEKEEPCGNGSRKSNTYMLLILASISTILSRFDPFS
ncbi:Voltage-dependent calcium channel subunit alpha-2/delta-3 [Nymphon striatum]|nr:Voltage-dependent calcium channel subunit alpha-2/delta-3 [Nymphon striatum]